MVRLIVGHKGKGKTTEILQIANQHIKEATGNVVYLDKSNKHMYELNNKIRLIDVSRYPIENSEQFIGFVCGIVSQDHDLQEMYLDGLLKCAKLKEDEMKYPLKRYGTPEDIANLAIYLLSEAAAWMTGSNIKISGGMG